MTNQLKQQALTVTRYAAIKGENDAENTLMTTQVTVEAQRFPRMIASRVESNLSAASLRNAQKGVTAVEELCKEIISSTKQST